MRNHRPPPPIGWGCLVGAILVAVAVAGLAVIFLWDVNAAY